MNSANSDSQNQPYPLTLNREQSAQKDILERERENYYSRIADEELKQEQKSTQQTAKKAKKSYDLFAESSDEDHEDESQNGSESESRANRGFMVANPSVDDDGYYQPKVGEIINSRYRVKGVAGKGVFSCVVKAADINNTSSNLQEQMVAIKIIRNKFEVMH